MDKANFNNDKPQIFKEVIRSFIRVLKNRRKYSQYYIASLLELRSLNGDWFNNKKENKGAIGDVYNNLYLMVKRDFSKVQRDSPYDFITICINVILREFGERRMFMHPKVLSSYGQECFDLTCQRIYPNDYEKDLKELDELQVDGEKALLNIAMEAFVSHGGNPRNTEEFNHFFQRNKNSFAQYLQEQKDFQKNCQDDDFVSDEWLKRFVFKHYSSFNTKEVLFDE